MTALALAVSSCQDWLDMPSESKADSSTIFSTVSRAEMTVMGAYSSLHTQELGYQLLMGTDECASTESNSKYNVANYDYTNTSGMLSKTYTEMYKAIEYSNVCIKNLPGMSVDESEQAKVNALLGESLAIRAYAYWNIVRFYGDVPYTDVPTSDLTTFSSSRVSRDTIYDHCIADLQRAIELLPWRSEGMVETPERFTKNAAYGILARVALYAAGYSLRWDLNTVPYNASSCRIAQREDQTRVRELYQIAADACKAVITKGENSLMEDYDEIFRDLGNQRYNNETMLEFGWYGANSSDVRTGYTNGIPTSGTDNDVLGKGGSQMIAMPTFYFEYEEGDQRRESFFYALDSTDMNSADLAYLYKWREPRYETSVGWITFTGMDCNRILIRLADIYLLRAECEAKLGMTTQAENDLNAIRGRRGATLYPGGTNDNGGADLQYSIFLERERELLFEGHRYYDAIRNGYYGPHNPHPGVLPEAFDNLTDKEIQDGAIYLPIPETAFNNNDLMLQNIYWQSKMR